MLKRPRNFLNWLYVPPHDYGVIVGDTEKNVEVQRPFEHRYGKTKLQKGSVLLQHPLL